ncbi:uracil phosphoribosyltransferase [Pelolinea submarina]|uniref:Uracil phosphoribosyltransferase n=1 Tax=Pelolinea submarina TaxID=913107 RepID=A0A347ZV45_9CHLR|nr:uracil phosphoribosyltransferase [Pelolinea submarina]REG10238.1 uracil phosphoribosyltransferase [Pelolinea submarina]BBB49176.1 uracil phosphoribosyltransferase [Pelolinea submarina]
MENVFVSSHPLVKHKLSKLRDTETTPKKFRELIREIAGLIAYEATSDLLISPVEVQTPLALTQGWELMEKIGLVPILRSGLGMVEGVWELVPTAEVWHIGLYRDEKTLKPVEYYNKLPIAPSVGVCLILDPMLATGGSAVATISILKKWGVQRIKFMGIIAAPEGIQTVHDEHPDVPLYLAAVDEHLNEVGYIVPGLGDAGDRQFGTA